MTRFLLFLLFSVMLVADMLGLNLSLAPGLSVKNAFIYLIFSAIAIETALKRNRRIELLPVIVPYSVGFFYAAFTVVVVALLINYTGYSWVESVISLKGGFADNLIVLLVFYYGVLSTDDAFALLKAVIWVVILVNVVTVFDAFVGLEIDLVKEGKDGRLGGPIGEPNQYAAFLALLLPSILALCFVENGIKRMAAIVGFAASLLAFLMTASRGGVAGIVLGTAIGALYLRKYISTKHFTMTFTAILLGGPIAVGVLYLGGFGDLFYDRFIELSGSRNSWALSSGRTEIWSTALAKMFEQPVSILTGFGWDSYRQAFIFRYAPHNTYLKFFFELGGVGLLLIIAALVNVVRTARRGISEEDDAKSTMLFAFMFGFLGMLMAIFFVDLTSPWILIWAYIGIVMRLSQTQTSSIPVAQSSSTKRSSTRNASHSRQRTI